MNPPNFTEPHSYDVNYNRSEFPLRHDSTITHFSRTLVPETPLFLFFRFFLSFFFVLANPSILLRLDQPAKTRSEPVNARTTSEIACAAA
ncbi:hypothetical protein ANTPLA_LOCUS3133 [Anthophora plagiata]